MRYLSAQWPVYLDGSAERSGANKGLWLENARHANAMAARLAEVLAHHPQVRITQKVESNQIFCILPADVLSRLRERYFFYMWNEAAGEARFVTSWDTTPSDIDEFETILTGRSFI